MSSRALDFLDNFGELIDFGNQSEEVNGTSGNVTNGHLTPLSNGEVITVSIVGLLGLIGIMMNTGVLAVVYKGKLVKSDYRMLYYIFMTCGDLMFALHTFINAFSLLFRDFYVFRIFAVCWNIQLLLGVTSYQWSAICIILLIIDLTWSVKYPFSDNEKKKLFSKFGCIGTFFLAIALVSVPFLYWKDSPSELVFCSIGNVYGKHWDFYQQEAVSFLSVLLLCMVSACFNLLITVYRKNSDNVKPKVKPTTTVEVTKGCHSPHPRIKDRVVCEPLPKMPKLSTRGENVEARIKDMAVCEPHDEQPKQSTRGSKGKRVVSGQINLAFNMDDEKEKGWNPVRRTLSQVKPRLVGAPNHGFLSFFTPVTCTTAAIYLGHYMCTCSSNIIEHHVSQVKEAMTQAQAHRQTFIRACRTVSFFVATYMGCCLPYYILLVMRIGCGTSCTEDTPDSRRTRAIIASFLYLLPIIDPILYIKRFQLFNRTIAKMFRSMNTICSSG